MPGDGVKGKTWGPSSATAHVKQRPALPATTATTAADTGRWAASSGPAQEMSPRNLVNVPTVGTVTEGETHTLYRTLIVRYKCIDMILDMFSIFYWPGVRCCPMLLFLKHWTL